MFVMFVCVERGLNGFRSPRCRHRFRLAGRGGAGLGVRG